MSLRIQKSTARSQALSVITDLVLDAKLPPGERINESALAKELGVSQTPVREALLCLEGQGLLTCQPDRGFFVRELDVREVKNIYPVLAALESYALSLIDEFSALQLQQLRKINEKLSKAKAYQAIELDDAWHETLLAPCGNAYLLANIRRVRNDMKRYEALFFRESGNRESSGAEHNEIVELLGQGSRAKAQATLERNCVNTVEEICEWLESRT